MAFLKRLLLGDKHNARSQPTVETPPPLSANPWRNVPFSWDERAKSELLEMVKNHQPPPGSDVGKSRILVMGFVGAGKSSFFNTVNSACQGKVKYTAIAGTGQGRSLTKKFRIYSIFNRNGQKLNFQLCDTMGAELSSGLHDADIPFLIGGNIPDGWMLSETHAMDIQNEQFIYSPSLEQRPHAVVLIIKANEVAVLGDQHWAKIGKIRQEAHSRDIPVLVILTHIDLVCTEVDQDISKVFHSKAVKDMVIHVHIKTGIPEGQILPVRNYFKEQYNERNIDILALETMRFILDQAEGHVQIHGN